MSGFRLWREPDEEVRELPSLLLHSAHHYLRVMISSLRFFNRFRLGSVRPEGLHSARSRRACRSLVHLISPLVMLAGALAAEQPAGETLRLHPDNPRYFLWRGKATALITSAEHYGAVINPDFDYRKYLAALAADGMNYTRIFVGSYVEKPGAFGILRNTLAPESGRFLAPWARSSAPGYAGGGNKFDLDQWNTDFFQRLRDFVAEADRRGIAVEITLFCSIYNDLGWSISPFNPANHVNDEPLADWKKLHTLDNGGILARQEALTRKIVRELNGAENIFYEIQNEPWADQHTIGDPINPYLMKERKFPNVVEITAPASVAWQTLVAAWIADAEAELPRKHLIAQNISNFRLPVRESDVAPGVSILNFHYAYPEAVSWNSGLRKLIGYDETGFAGRADETYRRDAWAFVLAGGGLYNNLDYSFHVGAEQGIGPEPEAPGGGSAALRRQLRVLADFIHSFDLGELTPDLNVVRNSPGVVTRALSRPGKEYGIPATGRGPCRLSLGLPDGTYSAEWLDTANGRILKPEDFTSKGGAHDLQSPEFTNEIALRVKLK